MSIYIATFMFIICTRPKYKCRCDERLKTKAEESTRLAYTGLLVELEHPKDVYMFIMNQESES
jgi:hypothetical protein